MNKINTVEGLRAELQEHVVNIEFVKQNGDTRHLAGTTQPAYLETVENLTAEQADHRAKIESEADQADSDLVRAYDTANGGWRSFHLSQVVNATVA